MRRMAVGAAILVVAVLAPSQAEAQATEGMAQIGVVSAPPAWLAGGAVDAPAVAVREVAPEALVAVRRANRQTGVTLMIVGLAGVLTGLIVDESAITIAGAVVGGVGLFMYLN
ncbi:MAG TPA: hypothetical protein VFN96_05000 [Gemmatimonadales bacterium]|nr:hypothetical protein [Gemmatimonadales bacterium]